MACKNCGANLDFVSYHECGPAVGHQLSEANAEIQSLKAQLAKAMKVVEAARDEAHLCSFSHAKLHKALKEFDGK